MQRTHRLKKELSVNAASIALQEDPHLTIPLGQGRRKLDRDAMKEYLDLHGDRLRQEAQERRAKAQVPLVYAVPICLSVVVE